MKEQIFSILSGMRPNMIFQHRRILFLMGCWTLLMWSLLFLNLKKKFSIAIDGEDIIP